MIETPRQRRTRRIIVVLGMTLAISFPLFMAILATEMAEATAYIAELEAKLKECKP